MNIQIVAAIISAGTELLGEVIRNRAPASLREEAPPTTLESLYEPTPIKKRKPFFVVDPENDIEEEEQTQVTVNIKKPHIPNKGIKLPTTSPTLNDIKALGEDEEQTTSTRKLKQHPRGPDPTLIDATKPVPAEVNKATAIPTGCIPCSLGHVGTCSGLLNEATRFARGAKGAADPEVIDRVNMCLDELNSLEREDLRPEKVVQLSGWERDLADKVLSNSRATRHKLEDVSNLNTRGLEAIAGETQAWRQEVGRDWFQSKIANLSPDDQENIKTRVMAKLNEMREQAARGELPEAEETEEEETVAV